jgi:hypothetical protein
MTSLTPAEFKERRKLRVRARSDLDSLCHER